MPVARKSLVNWLRLPANEVSDDSTASEEIGEGLVKMTDFYKVVIGKITENRVSDLRSLRDSRRCVNNLRELKIVTVKDLPILLGDSFE